jgi:hypothetical protein
MVEGFFETCWCYENMQMKGLFDPDSDRGRRNEDAMKNYSWYKKTKAHSKSQRFFERMKRVITGFTILLLITNFANAQTPAQTIPAFDFYKLDKTVFTNKNLPQDKIMFFLFFDPGCEHCQHAIANLNKNFKSYKNTAVYLICLDDEQTITTFINKYAPSLKRLENVTLLRDTKNEFIARFKPVRYPSMFLYSFTKELLDYEDNENSMFRFFKYLKQQ